MSEGSTASATKSVSVSSRCLRAAKVVVLVAFGFSTLLALTELGVRALYQYAFWSTEQVPLIYERIYWAVPPWVARTSVLYDDPELGLWMKPNSNRTYVNLFGPIGSLSDVGNLFNSLFPTLPDWAKHRPVWHLSTNSVGARGDELPSEKGPDTLRIVVLGDSWTVGINVELESTYPARLRDLLMQHLPKAHVEVVNLGVIGGGAETGVRLIPRVRALAPDVVVVAYAQNDEAETRAKRPKLLRAIGQLPFAPTGVAAVLRQSELYKLYQWWRTPGENRIEATLRGELTRTSAVPANSPGRPCSNDAYADSRYSKALTRIVRSLTATGIDVILLYNNVPNFSSHCTRKAMQAIASSDRLAMVDSSDVLEKLEGEISRDRERRLGLAPSGAAVESNRPWIEAVLRVEMANPLGHVEGVPYVMGNSPALGDFVPNGTPLFDDATHGDEVAGDGVWSRTAHYDEPAILTYLFTNGSDRAAWTGLENYRLRAYALRPGDLGHVVYLPVEQFGVHSLRSDSSHPDATGYSVIADALADAIRETPASRRFAATN